MQESKVVDVGEGSAVEEGYGMPMTLNKVLPLLTNDQHVFQVENVWDFGNAVYWVKEELKKMDAGMYRDAAPYN